MKKILLTTALLGAASLANAAIFAGFSFNGVTATNSPDWAASDFSDLTGDLSPDTGGYIGTSNATLYYDGSNGSYDFGVTGGFPPGAAFYSASSIASNNILSSRQGSPNLYTGTVGSSIGFYSAAVGNSFVIALDALTGGDAYSDIVLSYAAANQSGVGSAFISWEVSFTDALTGYSDIATDNVTATVAGGNSGESFTHSVTGTSSTVWIRGTIDSIAATNNPLLLDNIILSGNVVPEPSTYAAIAGGLALAFVALRRRLRK